MHHDIDPTETREWLESLDSVMGAEGVERAAYLLERMAEQASREGTALPYSVNTPYRNTIPASREARMPGDLFMERRIRSLIRWNALVMVIRANRREGDLGGHISSFSSIATLLDVGFNYFFRGSDDKREGDLIYFQGHSSPGLYARSFLEGNLTETQMDNFRREVDGNGLSSYPHPWLMPDYWQFPTVSMGLGPIQAIYQAHVMKYLDSRELVPRDERKVWCYVGDGECDEPESLGAIGLAGREKLDNLIFVVNCNLQRLDGPVRGNGKIIQELEGVFRGAGWNVIKVVWGRLWDPLFETDTEGRMQRIMDETVDGQMQNFKSNGGGFVRKHFFGQDPEVLKMVEHLSDEDIYNLNRGGHDPYKVYAAYHAAVNHKGQPTVILAHTIKGYGFGDQGQAQNTSHQLKKLDIEGIKAFRDRFGVPVPDEDLESLPYYRPAPDSPEMRYMRQKRDALGGSVPRRRKDSQPLAIPPLSTFKAQLEGSGDRELSTTMAFVRQLGTLVKDKQIGRRVVPIVPDEARTFGMDGMFRQLGIYTAEGQKYTPNDHSQLMYYKESQQGQILEEGINEAGAMSAWIAAATSYSTNDYPLIPFYIFYSMFGFQRVGDLCWAAGDMRSRGFLLGGTAGRTTLNGEGLQHQDGHSHLLSATVPNCVSYDPTFGYEVAVIVHDGLKRMYQNNESVYYYITLMNENYVHPAMPEGVEEGILKGIYRLQSHEVESDTQKAPRVQLLGSGTILNEVRAAAVMLQEEHGVSSDVWSVTSFTELARDGQHTERWNRLHPQAQPRVSYLTSCLENAEGPVIASTDYMRLFADQVRSLIPADYTVLGTDGFGRSDTREKLRSHFEVDRFHVVVAALGALARQGKIETSVVSDAITKYGIDADKPNPAIS
ncbi:MAG: pyruvate dehydrogenase (acetyl-transferring), homodimeric type [unclassified Hahellaceae]|nr:pyruvate dehydrogenase (acetyl-transferring), homodimeric type [Hahellaceae bacterium]|tara:strand:+ start:8660 stop:11323 length:2664 start_codon:yes stop_codon:yes gene_type:complete